MSELDHLSITSMLQDVYDSLHWARDVLSIIGVVYTTKIVFSLSMRTWSVLRTYIIPRFWYDKDFSRKYGGKWAVITGASEGIGRSYAHKLAARHMNVFLISRNIKKLEKAANEISSLYHVNVKCFAIDLCSLSEEGQYKKLAHEIEKMDVGVLVNNVGVMYDNLQYFLTVERELQIKIIDLSVNATILMTYMILPSMIGRKKGAIINIGSIASLKPTPLMTTYSAAKGFTDMFTKALEYEYACEGITLQVVQPGYVSTAITHHAKSNILMVDSDTFVESALRTLGVTRRCYGYWGHGLFGLIGEVMPECVYNFGTVYINPYLWGWLTGVSISHKKMK